MDLPHVLSTCIEISPHPLWQHAPKRLKLLSRICTCIWTIGDSEGRYQRVHLERLKVWARPPGHC